MEKKIISTAYDIAKYERILENGEEPKYSLFFECPVCGGIYNYTNVIREQICRETDSIAVNAYEIVCENHSCSSLFIYTNISGITRDYEFQDVVADTDMADYMHFSDTPNIDRFIPAFLRRYYTLAYETLSVSPESSAVYVRKMLESFISNRWPLVENAVTGGRKTRKLRLSEKIRKAYDDSLITADEKKMLDQYRDILNSAAHDGTNSSEMTPQQVTAGLNILMKIIRKYTQEVTSNEKTILDNLQNQYGIATK